MSRTREMKKTGLILLVAMLALTAGAQKDPEAVSVLSEFSKKATSAPSVKIDFTVITNDSREGDITTLTGSAVIAGDRYRITLPENEIWADGKAVWSYLPDIGEVTITEPDPYEDSFMSKPSLLFTMYEEGYKVRLVEQNGTEWVIDLYPEEIENNLVRIRLRIGKSGHVLRSAEYRTKDGITVTLTADSFDLTFRPPADYFSFDPAAHKGVDIIDMR